MRGPGWPDVRGWATLGIFALVTIDLILIAFAPGAAENELFKTISTLLWGSGAFGLVCAFLWGGSAATKSAIDTVNEIAKQPPQKGAKVEQMNVDAEDVTVQPKA